MIQRSIQLMGFVFSLVLFAASGSAEEYGIVCPLFTMYMSGEGEYVAYCHAYESSCEETPDEIFRGWGTEEPVPCDCPDTSGCRFGGSTNWFASSFPPIADKITANGLPVGFSKKASAVKASNVYVMKDGEPVYFRILRCVFQDLERPERTCSYSMGFEMKSPLKGIDGLSEAKNWQPTENPNVLKVLRGNQFIYLVRAETIKKVVPAPTPVPSNQSDGLHERASALEPGVNAKMLDQSVMVKF